MSNSSLPNSPNRLPTWFLLLAALGIPSAAGLTFAQTITQHPWQALGIALLYEAGILLISMVTGVWQQRAKRIIDWVDSRIDALFFNYQGSYCRQLRGRCREVPLQSALLRHPLEVKRIFVAPKLALRTRDQGTANPLESSRVFRGQHVIWNYLSSETETMQHLVIIGAPGSGKSTLLQNVALTLVDRETRHRKPRVPYRLPFLLLLKTYSEIPQGMPSFSLADSLANALQKQQGNIGKQAIPQEWIQDQLMKGRCLVLLDGLDEISDSKSREQVAKWIQEQIYAYGNNNCFVITSRPSGYDGNPLDGVMQLAIQEFTFEQIKEFINKWYYAIEAMPQQKMDEETRMRAEESARELLQRLRSVQALFDLACNPLLLTMMAIIHQYQKELPDNRAALYKEICHVFLESPRARSQVPVELKLPALQTLASGMMTKGIEEVESNKAESVIKGLLEYASPPIDSKVFLQEVKKDGVWIEGQQPGTYRFIHKTFQEYLTAMYVREKSQEREQLLVDHIHSNWWHETIFLYCTTGDATAIMSACLKENRLSKDAMELALDLQLHMVKETTVARPDVREQFTHAFSQAIEGEDAAWRHNLAEALLTRRTRHLDWVWMGSLNDEPSVADTSLITCAEYQLFLDEQKDRGYDYRPDHWGKEHRFAPGQGLLPILGIRPSDADAFCNWLTARDPSGAYRYRLPKISEYEREEISGVKKGTVYWVRKDTGFTWEGELPNNVRLEQLEPFYEKDMLARDHYFKVHPSDNLPEQMALAHALIDIRHKGLELANALTSIRQIVAIDATSVETDYQEVLQQCEEQIKHKEELLKQIGSTSFESQHLIELRSHLAHVRTCTSTITSTIDRICKPLLAPDQEVGFDKPFADALARNHILDFDSILSSIEDNDFKHAFKNAPAQISKSIFAYAQETVQSLLSLKHDIMNLKQMISQVRTAIWPFTSYMSNPDIIRYRYLLIGNLDIHSDEVDLALTHAHSLASGLGSSHTSDSILDLANRLMFYLEHISKNRLDLRRRSILRWYIRFFSRVLVGHLLYWGQNEVSQDIIDAYLDIYIAFVLLEGRIGNEPSFLPCEGILIVKEHGEIIPAQR